MAEACTGVICSNFMEESTPRIHGDKAGRSWDQAPAAMGAGDASVGMPTRCRKMKKKAAGGEGSSAVQASRPKTAAIPRAAIAFFFWSLCCQWSAEHRVPG